MASIFQTRSEHGVITRFLPLCPLARCLRCSSRSLQPGRAALRHCNQPALCQRDVTGLEAHQPRALAEGHTAKTVQDFRCRDMEAISLCVPFAATRTRTGEVVLVLQTHRLVYNFRLAITDAERRRSNPIGLIGFSRANPSRGSGQDKTRSGENRANAIRIVGPHQIYR